MPFPETPEIKHRFDSEVSSASLIKTMQWLGEISPVAACLGGGFLIACIGFLSYVTDPQFSCSLLYLIPILLVTRVAGFRFGLLACVLATGLWLTADLSVPLPFRHPLIPYWNAGMRFGTFFIGILLVSAMRSLNAHLEERVFERTMALETQFAERRKLEKNILEISDREQVRLGQDLHDGLCQQLVSAAFSANILQQSVNENQKEVAGNAFNIAEMIDDAITQARNLARGLYPVRLEEEGLEIALRELASTVARRFGMVCNVSCDTSLPVFKASVGIHLYRIAQEAITNSAKHSGAKNISIVLSTGKKHMKMMIIDNGGGIGQISHQSVGMGLSIMEYRARLIDATFEVISQPDNGTKIVCVVKLSV